jgi:uncharacterized protein (DUF1778 family)
MKRKMGRPPKPLADLANSLLSVRLTQEAKALVRAAAKRNGQTVSTWVGFAIASALDAETLSGQKKTL